jgi:hypothetical protein
LDELICAQKGLLDDAQLFRELEYPLVDFYPERFYCAIHDTRLRMVKTDTRKVRGTQYPPFMARKVFLYCPTCKKELEEYGGTSYNHKPDIPVLMRGKSPFPMEIVARVGLKKFIDCMRGDQIQGEFETRYGIHVSTGALSAMSKEFLVRLKCLHMLRMDRLVDEIERGGGYVLGIDGTGDGASDRIFFAMDVLRDWVLVSARIQSESGDNMEPHVRVVHDTFGKPLACVRDMAGGMKKALDAVLIDVPQRVCHYHFVDDIGKDLMAEDYAVLRDKVVSSSFQAYLKRLRKSLFRNASDDGIDIRSIVKGLKNGQVPENIQVEHCIRVQTYDIISWILRYSEDNHGMRFPFILPYLNFHERCRQAVPVITHLRRNAGKGRSIVKYLWELELELNTFVEGVDKAQEVISKNMASLVESSKLLNELRDILRIPADKGDIPRDKLIIRKNEDINKMRMKLEAIRERLANETADGSHPKERIVQDHLDKYWDHLILDNVGATIDGEEVVIEIPRTSSSNETCFGGLKSDIRKRIGKMSVARELNWYGEHLGYVQNLKSERYVELMFGSLDGLAKAFEDIPADMVTEGFKTLSETMEGYDVTKRNSEKGLEGLAEIKHSITVLEARIEDRLYEEFIRPPEMYGRQSNGFLTL